MTIKPPEVNVWMPVYIKDRRARTSTLSHLEHSALDYLEMLLWENGGTIRDDDRTIARELRVTVRQWQGMRAVLLHDCTVTGGIISHPAIIAEVEKAKANVEQKRKAGRASAAARTAQRESNGCSTAVATAVQPRAGGGEGTKGRDTLSLYQEERDSRGVETYPAQAREARAGLAVIAGGAK